MKLKPSPFQIAALVVVVTHFVGIVGYLSEWRATFVGITPFHLILSVGLLIYQHEQKNRVFWFTITGLALAGFAVEVIGINTGVIFGEYTYDSTLGPKIWGTPPVIGLNWMMLIVALGSVLAKLNVPNVIRAMCGALCMVAIDFIIEPVAIEYGFWHWERTTVPTHNYLGWLITAFIFFLVYLEAPFKKNNKLSVTLLLMQIAFFGLLNLFL